MNQNSRTDRIDLKDRKLLVALSQNSRASQSQLGKAVGISKSAVPYRIKKLQEEGIIRRFLTVVNLSAIGYTTYNVFFQLNVTKQREAELFHYFDNHPFTTWVCRFLGMWDFHVEIVAKDFAHFNQILSEIVQELGDALEDYHTHIALEIYKVEHLPKQFVEDAHVEAFEAPPRQWKETVALDAIDRKLLFQLNNNAVAPLHILAEQCGTTLDIIHYRMKKLFKEGVILQYIPFIALEKLGYTEYFCHVQLRHLTPEKAQSLKQWILQHKQIKYGFRGASQLEVLFVLTVQNTRELDALIQDLKQLFFSHILEIQHHLITEQGKFHLFPEGLTKTI